MNGTNRADIKIGMEVDIVLKKDQPTGKLTHGRVAEILTSDSQHHRGIKVRLEDGLAHQNFPKENLGGRVGRVQKIYPVFPKINGVEYQEGLT